jgi:hypothetical protein
VHNIDAVFVNGNAVKWDGALVNADVKRIHALVAPAAAQLLDGIDIG